MREAHEDLPLHRSTAFDAMDMLTQDHRQIQALLEAHAAAVAAGEPGAAIARRRRELGLRLTVHVMVEHEVLLAAAVERGADPALVSGCAPAQDPILAALARIDAGSPATAVDIAAGLDALRDALQRHIAQQEGELFPQVRGSGLDLDSLGAQIERRGRELLDVLDVPGVPDVDSEAGAAR